MASLASQEYYRDDMTRMPPLRAMAQTLCLDRRVRTVSAAEAYELARQQHDVLETDLPIYPPAAKRLGLPDGATVLVNCHGRIVGRTARARRFSTRMGVAERRKVEADVREALYEMARSPRIKADAILGLDSDLMIKATMITTEDDAMNLFNWLVNFTPYPELAEAYAHSRRLPIPDILVVGYNRWTTDDPYYHNEGGPQLALVDEEANVIFNLGMRYFGERKKGTLTLAWTSGMRLGLAACHGGIKEIDFSTCQEPAVRAMGKRSIAFFGLSGTGKSSHTNAHDNGGTLPAGATKVVLHDDAFQIDCMDRVCRVWEPTLFDKTDSRPLGHPDWRYVISAMNVGLTRHEGKIVPLGQDIRSPNGRALIDRDLLGAYVNRCSFPDIMVWLMKDTSLPPVIRFTNTALAVAMGASLMTRRNLAENVSEEELKQLVFEPFANPFRVYELWKDVEAFISVFEAGAVGYAFNSVGFWKTSERELSKIPLQTSLTLQTALLLGSLEWEDWDILPGAQIPTRETAERLVPNYAARYDPRSVENPESYREVLQDRFHQRRVFLQNSDLHNRPELLMRLVNTLMIRA